jgi:hypothetical protein
MIDPAAAAVVAAAARALMSFLIVVWSYPLVGGLIDFLIRVAAHDREEDEQGGASRSGPEAIGWMPARSRPGFRPLFLRGCYREKVSRVN